MRNKNLVLILILLVSFLIQFENVYALTSYNLNYIGQNNYKIEWSSSANAQYSIKCNNAVYSCICSVNVGNIDTGEELYSQQVTISAGQTNPYPLLFSSESKPSKKSVRWVVGTSCHDSWDATNVDNAITYTVSWPTDSEWSQYQSELSAQSKAQSDVNIAKSLISTAQSEISKATSKINEAKKLGEVSSAERSLGSANNHLTNAQSYLSAAESAFSSKNYDTTSSKASQAQASANNAKSDSNSAYTSAIQIIELFAKAQIEAQNKVSDAKSAVDRTNELVKKAEGIISNASVLGLDTASAKANLDTGKAKADLGNNYYNEAKTALDQKNFDSAKSKASSAISYANEGEQYATSAYNSLATQVQKLDAVAQALLNANKEVTEMNELYTKMDFIIKSTEKYGLTLTDAKNVVVNAKTDIDTAEDLFSQAKHRREAGSFQEAADFAIQARDAASKATNRLDTITQSISNNVEGALDKAYQNMNEEITSVESEVISAEKSYGSDSKAIINAKNSLSEAKNSLSESKTAIESVKVSSGLKDVLTQADNSFKKLDAVQDKLNTSLANISSARRIKLIKITSIAAAIAAAGGGGFLYWKKSKKSKLHKKETKGDFCDECGERSGSGKFCHNCGAKHK